jgi:hypothetical protein
MKKKLSQKQFDRKIKIWSAIISPILVALIGALTTISVAYISSISRKQTQSAEVQYRITEKDSLDIEILSAQIDTLRKRYYITDDPIERDKLNVELTVIAQKEADIYRKYFLGYTPRWPPYEPGGGEAYNDPIVYYFFIFAAIIGILMLAPVLFLLIWGAMLAIRPVVRKTLRKRYEVVQ